jgi:hypothetical protein
MGCFIFLDYLIGFIVLIKIHAPWWAWLLYAISALVGVVIWAMNDSGNGNTTDTSKQEQP